MATAESVKNKIQGLIDSANATTGNSDADMTTAVASLIAGFGSSGDSSGTAFYTGTHVWEERWTGGSGNTTLELPATVEHFVLYLAEAMDTTTGYAFLASLVADKTIGYTASLGTNNAGTAANAGTYYAVGEPGSYYPGVTFGEKCITFTFPNSSYSEKYWRVPQAGTTYAWVAW